MSKEQELLDYKKKLLKKTKERVINTADFPKIKDIGKMPPAKAIALIEDIVNDVVKKNIEMKSISKYVAVEFLEIYKAVGGRKKLIKYFKENPKEIVGLLKHIAAIANDNTSEKERGGGNKGALIQFIGVKPPEKSEVTDVVVTQD